MNKDYPPSTTVNFLVALASFVIIVAGMYYAAPILIPFLLACFVAIICAPPLRFFMNLGISSALSVTLVLTLLFVVGLLVLIFVGASLNDFTRDIPVYQVELKVNIESILAMLALYGLNIPEEDLLNLLNPVVTLGMASNALGRLGTALTNTFFIAFTVAFILLEASTFKPKIRLAFKNSQDSLERFEMFMHSVNKYLAIKTVISLATGVFIWIGLEFIGVKHAILWGLVAFLLNYIPNIGSIIAAIPPVILALVQLGFVPGVLTAALYLAVNTIIGNILEPQIMGHGLGLSTLVVFLSLVFWGSIFGPVGMLLSIPLTMIVKIALEHNEGTRWISIMLGPGTDAIKELERK